MTARNTIRPLTVRFPDFLILKNHSIPLHVSITTEEALTTKFLDLKKLIVNYIKKFY
jgi:hypothetical protein